MNKEIRGRDFEQETPLKYDGAMQQTAAPCAKERLQFTRARLEREIKELDVLLAVLPTQLTEEQNRQLNNLFARW